MTDKKPEDIKPIANFVLLALQVDGFCQAISTAMQLELSTGPTSASMLKTFVDEAKRFGEGRAFENLPEVLADIGPTDLLAVATVLRSLLWAFLDESGRGTVAAASEAFGLAAFHEHRQPRPDVLDSGRTRGDVVK